MEIDDITLAILAGGEGSRMGMPKALLQIQGRPILDYLLDEVAWNGPTMLITAPGREHPPGWQRFGIEAADPESGGGPLRGVLTALEHLHTPLLLVLTVDMPNVRKAHCQMLIDAIGNRPEALGLMMQRMIGGVCRIEPFPLILRRSAQPEISAAMQGGRRSMHGLVNEKTFLAFDAPKEWDDSVWANLNTPDDLD